MAIFALISAVMITMATGGFVTLQQGGEQTEAQALAQEGVEAVRSIRDNAWNELQYSTSSVSIVNAKWAFDGEGTTEIIGDYTRTISFSDVCRDVSDDITTCPGSYTDVHSKKVTAEVVWEVRPGITNTVRQIGYLTNWDTNYWPQSDWVGGSGQSVWSNITRYDSADGILDVNTGEVILDQTTDTSASTTWPFDVPANYSYVTTSIDIINGFAQLVGTAGSSGDTVDDGFENTTSTSYDWSFITAGNYTYDSADIEVVGGVAQVKAGVGGSCSGTPNACSTFGTSGTCGGQDGCSWGGGSSGATTNADFSSALTPWTSGTWSTVPTLSRSATGGNPTGYANIQFPNTKSKTSGGYFQQSFTTTGAASTATLNLDWIVSQYTGVADSLHLYVFIDTVAGTPTIGGAGQVWDSGNRTSVSSWANTGNINVASKITGAGTYYLKIVAYVDYTNGGPNRSYATGFDNVQLSWTGTGACSGTPTACNTYSDSLSCTEQLSCSWAGGSYPIDLPDIYPTSSYSALGVQSWDSFVETTNKNGGEIYYQLSDDDGTTWQYWTGSAWVTTTVSSTSNIASIINTNITSFNTSTEQIKFRAFLKSDGTQLVQLDNVNIGFTPSPAVWSFATWGVGGGEVVPTGVKQTTGGNLNNYVDVTVPAGSNDSVGGYWQQAFVTTENNPTVEINFDYKTIDFNGVPNLSEIRVYLDTATGDPVTQVGSSITVSAEGVWSSAVTIDASSAVTAAGTYYLKIAYWVETPTGGSVGPFTVGFDNINLVWNASGYPTDSPAIYNSSSFTPAAVATWAGFVETSTKNGGEIYYQLSNDDGVTWQYWTGSAWSVATATSTSNTASTINSAIPYFDTTAKKLMFKAFLVSDGTQFVKLDNIDLQYEVTSVTYHGNQFVVDSTSGVGALSNTSKMTSLRFTATDNKSVSSVQVYLEDEQGTSPVYRYGLQADNSGEPSGAWLGGTNQGYGDYQATAVGWQTIILNQNVSLLQDSVYHLVVEYQSGTVNAGNDIDLRRSGPINLLHAFDSSADVQSNILFSEDGGGSWIVQNYQPIYVLGFTDVTYEGNPYHEAVEHQIYGTNYFGQQFTVSGADIIVSTVGMSVSENNQGPEGDLILSFYDVTGGTLLATSTLTTSDKIRNGSYSWQEFFFEQPLTLSVGNTYRIYISAPDADVTAHYLIRSASHDNDSVLNSINYSGVGSFYVSSADGGGSWDTTAVNQDLIGFRFQQTIFNTSGYLVSSAYDVGSPTAFTVIEWDQTTPSCSPNCEVKIQIQTAPDNGGSPGTWSDTWCGPDGEDGDITDYFTTNIGQFIHTDHNGDQWIRYRAELVGDSTDTPTLEETRVYYK